MEFKRRTVAPSKSNKYYLHTTKGYNKCIRIKGDECIPNCVGYCYARYMEAQEIKKCNLPTCNAESWYKNYNGKKGSTVKLGSVVVWSKGKVGKSSDGAGHVAFVEKVNADGSFETSESAYKGKRWYTKKYNKKAKKSGYKLQGFIYPDTEFTENTDYTEGTYKLLYHKCLRSTPEVKSNNKIKYSSLTKTGKANCIKSVGGYAKTKVGAIMKFIEFTKDNKGNLWGKTTSGKKFIWVCVLDSTGKQVEKV